jgi:hypothetical protein
VLNPAQQRVLEALRAGERAGPADPHLGPRLRARLEEPLAELSRGLAEPVQVSKAALAQIHACEAHYRAEEATPFSWSLATARGTVAHKAIELSLHRRDRPAPLTLVDAALQRLADDPDHRIAGFLLGLDETDRAELRSRVNDVVAKFAELWPPLSPAWRPRTESATRAELCGGRIRLAGKIDLALGTPQGLGPGTVLVDLKTGTPHAGHLDDLRFSALMETLRVGVAPFRLAGYYLDAGTMEVEDVDEDVLESALRRTLAGARKVVELRLGLRTPSVTANARCRWCPARPDCPDGQDWSRGSPTGGDEFG